MITVTLKVARLKRQVKYMQAQTDIFSEEFLSKFVKKYRLNYQPQGFINILFRSLTQYLSFYWFFSPASLCLGPLFTRIPKDITAARKVVPAITNHSNPPI